MAILPTNFLNNIMNRSDMASTNAREAASLISDANKQAVLDLVESLSPGDTLIGKIISADNERLTLQTREGLTLTAKNGGEIALNEGETVSFTVERTNKKTVTLRPLFQNTSRDQTTVLALRQAGIPVNGRTIEMTARNMQYGNPIDQDSLLASYKAVSNYPEAPVKNIVDLQKMGIEVNAENLKQYDAYMNSENSVVGAFEDISKAFSDAVKDSLSKMLGGLEMAETTETLAQSANGGTEGVELSLSVPSFIPHLSESAELDSMLAFSEKLQGMTTNSEVSLSFEALKEISTMLGENNISHDNISNMYIGDNINPSEALNALLKDIKAEFTSLQDLESSLSGAFSSDMIEEINTRYNGLEQIIKSDIIESLLSKSIASQWTLGKDKVTDKKEVQDLYERLYSQTRELTSLLNQSTANLSAVMEPVNNLIENMDFMNNLNNYVPYIQIPFHNGESGRAGELYVFSNKKNMSARDGDITAFIHLDMNNLGPCDVYVKLTNNEAISTNFTLKDEETLDFISDHMDLLSKRIRERGYSFNAELAIAKEEKPVLEQVLENNSKKILIANTSFDARV